MTTHIMSLTYKSKIKAVQRGECGQTVRLVAGPGVVLSGLSERIKRPGDEILLHTWTGKPYRSRWGWQRRYVISEVLVIYCDPDGMWRWSPLDPVHGDEWECLPVSDTTLLDIVRRDHIDPPTILEWERTLSGLNGLRDLGDTDWQVIRWPCIPYPVAPSTEEDPTPWEPTIGEVMDL